MPFRYLCYSTLQKNLGRIDAICGYATLAVDLLSEELQENSSPREWLSGTAKLHGIVLHDVDDDLLPHRLAQMFIVTVHAQFEEFLQAFLDEHAESKTWASRADGQTLFHYVLKNLGMLFQTSCAAQREVSEYYRLIRNRFAHIEVSPTRIENQRNKVRQLLNITADYMPPKAFELLDYGDFALFTRTVKALGFQICTAARPSDQAIAEIAQRGEYAALKKCKLNHKRYRNALQQRLLMDYGLDETEVQPILKLVVGS